MLYTIGLASIYEPYLEDDSKAAKRGRNSPLNKNGESGGSVWDNYDLAHHSALMASSAFGQIYKVYGVQEDWSKCAEVPGKAHRELLEDAPLVSFEKTLEEAARKELVC